MKEILSREELIIMLKDAGNGQRLIDHSKMVADLSLRIANILIDEKGIHVNKRVLEAGAILHDISWEKHRGPDHCLIGHDMILDLGLPESVARIAEIHEPWSKEECETLKMPEKYCKDHFPIAWEEKIFIAGDSIPFFEIYSGCNPWSDKYETLAEKVLPFYNDEYFIPITGSPIDIHQPFLKRWIVYSGLRNEQG